MRSEDQVGLVLERLLKGLRGSLERGVDGGGHAHFSLRLLERGNGIPERDVGREIEGEGDSRILALVIDGERSPLLFPVGDGGKRNHCANGGGHGCRGLWRQLLKVRSQPRTVEK